MQSFDIHPGQEHGYRDSPKRRDDLQRVSLTLSYGLSQWIGIAISAAVRLASPDSSSSRTR